MRRLDVRRYREVHIDRVVADDSHRVRLVGSGVAHLSRSNFFHLAVDFELHPTRQNDEDLVAQIVRVPSVERARTRL